jgi:hypothetical protein
MGLTLTCRHSRMGVPSSASSRGISNTSPKSRCGSSAPTCTGRKRGIIGTRSVSWARYIRFIWDRWRELTMAARVRSTDAYEFNNLICWAGLFFLDPCEETLMRRYSHQPFAGQLVIYLTSGRKLSASDQREYFSILGGKHASECRSRGIIR